MGVTASPRRLEDYRDLHTGATVVICGCGASLADLADPEHLLTIGVNDVGRLFQPTYLVVLNPRRQFKGERFRYVEQSRARAIFTQLDLGLDYPHVVRFKLGKRGGTDLSDPDRLPHTRNSPYVALALAAHMGAEHIGLIGVDFTDHHFFAETGRHPLNPRLEEIDREYGRFAKALRERGVEVVNLSRQSRLTTLPKLEPEEFLAGVAASRPRARIEEKDMQIAVEKRPGTSVISTFLDTFAATAETAGFRVLRNPAALDPPAQAATVVWNGRRHRAQGPTVYAEHGWLPRSSYQVSPVGINADSHAAGFHWDGHRLAESEREAVHRHLDLLRRGDETQADDLRTDVEPAADLPEEFLLVPLQMEWDTNIRRHVPARFRKMQALVVVVNVVARNLGWLFEDLRGSFRSFRHAGVRVVTSTTAQTSADAWIFLRAQEASQSPDPKRTVVQIHDLFDEGLYRPGGRRACVARCGGVTLTHPEERRILEASGIDLEAKQVLERPLGALGAFKLRTALPKRFTVAWVGRPSRMFGQSPKRLGVVRGGDEALGGRAARGAPGRASREDLQATEESRDRRGAAPPAEDADQGLSASLPGL